MPSQSPIEVEDSGSNTESGDAVSLNDQLDGPKDDEATGLGHQQKGTWLQLPYYALLCLIELIRHNKA
jgi:hypothetical protein